MQSWQVLTSRVALDHPPWLSVWEQDVKLPNGHVIHDYLVTVARDYAMVFALCEDGKVPLVHQYKHGVGKVLHDLPAGYLDSEEPPLDAARRELREETGLTAPEWQALGSPVQSSDGCDPGEPDHGRLPVQPGVRDERAVCVPGPDACEP